MSFGFRGLINNFSRRIILILEASELTRYSETCSEVISIEDGNAKL
jgi:hypothetical protein